MSVPLRPDGLPLPQSAFDEAVVGLVADLFRAYPTWGTSSGYHAVDDRWPDLSEAGRLARLAMLRDHAQRLRAFDESTLTPDERVDRQVLLEEIEKAVFGDDTLRAEAWDPLEVVYLMGGGLFDLLSREFAPWSERGASLQARLEGLPTLAGAALEGLTGLPDRPVSLLHLDTALSQLAGVAELVDAAVTEARAQAEAGEAADLVAPMQAAAHAAHAALDAFRAGLDTKVRPRARGEGRLGPQMFAQKLRHTLGSDLGPARLRERAWADYHAVRAEIIRLARESWPTWFPDEPLPQVVDDDVVGEAALVKRVLDAIAERHQQPDGLISFCEAEIGRIGAFCADRGIITLPDEPLEITWTPLFLRAAARAFLDSPGPLDRGQKSHFWIDPARRGRRSRSGRVVPARREQFSPAHPQHPRGRPGPLPAAGGIQPLLLAGTNRLHQRHVRRGLGGLYHAGHVRRRLRVRRPRLRPVALEDVPARHGQRHPGRRDAHR